MAIARLFRTRTADLARVPAVAQRDSGDARRGDLDGWMPSFG
jgi:hypothetical protein